MGGIFTNSIYMQCGDPGQRGDLRPVLDRARWREIASRYSEWHAI